MIFDRINSVPDGQSINRTGPTESSSAQGGPGQAKAVNDQAQLSASQSRVQDLQAQLTRLPDVRQDRVTALQKALGNGSFNVSDEQLADAMLGDFFGPVTSGNQ
jgi:flagellar biosynthesis anti-sigma factor FlgM